MIPNVLAIAGSDPSGGAGIQADIKSISAQGCYAMAALTALTAQNTRGVSGIHVVPPEFVRDQIAAVFDDIRVDAVKIGMIANAANAEAVADALAGRGIPVVLDPVMVAKGGARLLEADAVAVLRDRLFPLAAVVTPNLPEAGDLLAEAPASGPEAMADQARRLVAAGAGAVLLKGGHLGGADSPDILAVRGDDAVHWTRAPRLATENTHGTGCTQSSALAAWLARGCDLAAAVDRAHDYVAAAIAAADDLSVGRGTGPTHHFAPGAVVG